MMGLVFYHVVMACGQHCDGRRGSVAVAVVIVMEDLQKQPMITSRLLYLFRPLLLLPSE